MTAETIPADYMHRIPEGMTTRVRFVRRTNGRTSEVFAIKRPAPSEAALPALCAHHEGVRIELAALLGRAHGGEDVTASTLANLASQCPSCLTARTDLEQRSPRLARLARAQTSTRRSPR